MTPSFLHRAHPLLISAVCSMVILVGDHDAQAQPGNWFELDWQQSNEEPSSPPEESHWGDDPRPNEHWLLVDPWSSEVGDSTQSLAGASSDDGTRPYHSESAANSAEDRSLFWNRHELEDDGLIWPWDD